MWSMFDAYAQAREDGSGLQEIYASECGRCRLIFGDIKTIRDARQHVDGGDHVVAVSGTKVKSSSLVEVQARIQAKPGKVIDDQGRVIRAAPGTPAYSWVFNVDVTQGRGVVLSATNLGV
jgi:hypothetical protein